MGTDLRRLVEREWVLSVPEKRGEVRMWRRDASSIADGFESLE